jgi:hypothetical protein
VPEAVKAERLESLQQLLNAQQFAFNKEDRRQMLDVLVERVGGRAADGRAQPLYAGGQFCRRCRSQIGQIVPVKLSTARQNSMTGEIIVDQGGSVNAKKLTSIRMDFEDNDILALLSGEHNHYLAHIEKSLDVSLDSFGNSIKISGPVKSTKTCTAGDRRSYIKDPHRRCRRF